MAMHCLPCVRRWHTAGVIVAGRPRPRGRRRRRRRLLTRALPVVVLAAAAFAAGVVLAMRPGHEERQMVTRYVRAWTHSDFAEMYALLDRPSREATTESRFARALETAADTATLPVAGREARRRPPGQRDRGGDDGPDQAVGHAARDAPGTAQRLGLHGPGALLRYAAVPGVALRREAAPPDLAAAPGDAAGRRRDSPGPGARPQLADPRRRQPDRRHGRPDPVWPGRMLTRRAAIRRTRRWASTASSSSSRTCWRAPPAGSCWPVIACWPTRRPRAPRRSRRRSPPAWSARRWPRSAVSTAAWWS